MSDPDHIRLMEAVARHFFGEPNRRLSNPPKGELRFGNQGSLSIDLKKGVWHDHEAKKGGGALDLIKRETRISASRVAYAWAEREGYWINGHAPGAGRLGEEIAHHPDGGELLLQVVRFAPKTFRQRQPDGKGGWIGNIKGVRRVPLPSFEAAFVPLWADVERDGLIAQFGIDVLRQIIEHACHSVGVRVDPWAS
jgi:hypothetical protein